MRTSVREGLGSALYLALVVGVLAFVNLFAARHHLRADLTSDRFYSLSPQSQDILRRLDQKITFLAFVKQEGKQKVRDVMENYQSPNLEVKIINPDRTPSIAKKYQVTNYNTYLLETANGRREIIKKLDEEGVTNALLRVTSGESKTIIFLTGHNERAPDDESAMGWKSARLNLETAAYEVASVNLFKTGALPETADLLVIAGPAYDYQEEELALIEAAIDQGTGLMVAIEPGHFPNLEAFLGKYGVLPRGDHVLDPVSQKIGFEPLVAAVGSFGAHTIVKDFRAATFFPIARSLAFDRNNAKGATHTVLGSTSIDSWGETDTASINRLDPVYEEGKDFPGPLDIFGAVIWPVGPAAADRKITEKQQYGRMAVIGDADFANNATLGLSANRDLFQNLVAWLLDSEERITLRPKNRGFNPILFTEGDLAVVFTVNVLLIPLAMVAVGVVVRMRRRRA